MSLKHDKLVEKAQEAIRAVFSDTSVDRNQTQESLEDLREEITGMLATFSESEDEEEFEDAET